MCLCPTQSEKSQVTRSAEDLKKLTLLITITLKVTNNSAGGWVPLTTSSGRELSFGLEG